MRRGGSTKTLFEEAHPLGERDVGTAARRRRLVSALADARVATVVFSGPARLYTFAVAESGLLAIGSETGDITLYDLVTGGQVTQLPISVGGGRIEALAFGPKGDRLVAFSSGTLHLFSISVVRTADSKGSPLPEDWEDENEG